MLYSPSSADMKLTKRLQQSELLAGRACTKTIPRQLLFDNVRYSKEKLIPSRACETRETLHFIHMQNTSFVFRRVSYC